MQPHTRNSMTSVRNNLHASIINADFTNRSIRIIKKKACHADFSLNARDYFMTWRGDVGVATREKKKKREE